MLNIQRINFSHTITLLISICIIGGCGIFSSSNSPSVQELRSAPEQINVAGYILKLETNLSRNFMPNDPDTRLMAAIWIIEKDSLTIPDWIKGNRLWVIYGEEVWETEFTGEPQPPIPPFKVLQRAREGPLWPVGAYVDVIVSVENRNSTGSLLKVSNQLIRRIN